MIKNIDINIDIKGLSTESSHTHKAKHVALPASFSYKLSAEQTKISLSYRIRFLHHNSSPEIEHSHYLMHSSLIFAQWN